MPIIDRDLALHPVQHYRLILREGQPVLQQYFHHPNPHHMGLIAEFRDVPGAVVPMNPDLKFWEVM